jgi:hypothetical protein
MTKRDRKNICVLLIAKHLINKSKIKVDLKLFFQAMLLVGEDFQEKLR